MNKKSERNIPDGEHFLVSYVVVNIKHLIFILSRKQVEDASSPVGFRVPTLPRFELSEKLAMKRGRQSATSRDEFLSAVVVVIIFAVAMGVILLTKVGETLV